MNITFQRLDELTDGTFAHIETLIRQLTKNTDRFTRAQVETSVSDPNIEIWLAKAGDDIVGTGTLAIDNLLLWRVAHVEQLVVDESMRGKGIGNRMMQKLIERARERGADHMDLTSNPARVGGNTLYQKLGFLKRDTNVYRLKL